MKTNLMRLISLVLVLMVALVAFAACGAEEEAPKTSAPASTAPSTPAPETEPPVEEIVDAEEGDPFTLGAETTDVLLIMNNETNERSVQVLEKSTMDKVRAFVLPAEGFTMEILDKDGKKVEDTAVVADGMTIQFVAADGTVSDVKLPIVIKTAEELEGTVSDNNPPVVTPPGGGNNGGGNNGGGNNGGGTVTPPPGGGTNHNISINLASIWVANYSAADANGKAWANALNAMKNKGIKTNISALDANSATDTIVKEVMAGKSSADVYDISQVMCRNVAKKKAAANMYASSTLNKSLFQCAATESVTFKGKAYGVTWASKSVNPMGVIYNKDLIKKYAANYDIVKLYSEKKWDFDNFQAIAKACTVDTDGNGKSDIYGFTSNTNVIGMALTSNAGGTALKVNEKVEATMCNEAGIKALEWCKEMFKTDKSWLYKADINQCVSEFAGGKAAMFVSYLQFYPQIAAQANFNIGFVLMPKGPAQSNYRNGVYDGAYYVVPTTKVARLNDVGTWLNELATGTSSAFLNNKVKDLAKNGFDAKSQEIYKWVVNNMTPEFSSGVFSSSISSEVDSSVTSAAKQPAKVMASIKTKAQKECDDYYAEIYALA
ncbi:MAG: hypothetical protein IKT68_00505 [Clostridia bacterium]|nr:hypothetical protein [Clostridia bacterium]